MHSNHQEDIVYLIGAGGSHASIKAMGSSRGILMRDVESELEAKMSDLVNNNSKYESLGSLVNEIIVRDVDFEHVITFLDQSPSALHREFGDKLKHIFEQVLSEQLSIIEQELGYERVALYAALLDMYNVEGINESLKGILTLNYDDYIEDAARVVYGTSVDFGITAEDSASTGLSLLKLHGSFWWGDTWPVCPRTDNQYRPLWIPPGIRKTKDHYPFNLIWGLAREVLDCDTLRVVGCRLGPNDWDLISLLFSTRHSNRTRKKPYVVEVIDSPARAEELKLRFPYLGVRSILEIETLGIGEQLVSEITESKPQRFSDLPEDEARAVVKKSERMSMNWFRTWLVQMTEGLQRELGAEATDTTAGALKKYLEV